MSSRPSSGTMVYWRLKKSVPGPWLFGYVTYEKGHELLRMGRYNGDSHGGQIVSASEIEWKPY
jgi:hypothetical protein